MLSLPVYLLKNTYYLHTRVGGHQIKRSLYTSDKLTAMVRAAKILECLKLNVRKFEIDISKGLYKAEGEEDHKRMMETLAVLRNDQKTQQPNSLEKKAELVSTKAGLRLLDLLDKFFLLKSHITPSTVMSYKSTVEEFSRFLKNPLVQNIIPSDVTRYQEMMAKKGNTTRTIDSKVGTIRALMNFAIKQGYYFEKNPAADRALQSKRERKKDSYGIFDLDEIKLIFESEFFKKSKIDDPDYYWTLVLALVTGCRVSEITSLKAEQFKIYSGEINYFIVRDAKTPAGIREIPFPSYLMTSGFEDFIQGKTNIFKYKMRLGKGSGNAVGKKFKRNLEEVKITRSKLVFHSLRKFFNDFLLKQKIQLEARCQFVGHEINNVNIEVYSNRLTLDDLAATIKPAQNKILTLTGILPTKF